MLWVPEIFCSQLQWEQFLEPAFHLWYFSSDCWSCWKLCSCIFQHFPVSLSAISRKTRIIDVVYNASNNELVRTKTLVKSTIVQIDATPFRQWYEAHYAAPLGRKKGVKLVSWMLTFLYLWPCEYNLHEKDSKALVIWVITKNNSFYGFRHSSTGLTAAMCMGDISLNTVR